MSENQTTTTTETTETQSTDAGGKSEFVSKADHDRALADLHKYKAKAREYETKVKDVETNSLKEKEDWKTLAGRWENDAKEAKAESDRIKASFLAEKKFSAVKEAAIKNGIRIIEDLEGRDLSEVIVETTSTGKINVLGADRYIENLKKIRPHWFGPGKVDVNGTVPGVKTTTDSGEITPAKLIELSKAASKSGDYSAYREATEKFQTQTRK